MFENMFFEKVETNRLHGFSQFDKEQTLKWLEEAQATYEKSTEEQDDLVLYRHCIENGYTIPGELQKDFAALLRDEIEKYIGWIKSNSDPVSAINAVDDAHFFKRVYRVYGY